MKTSLALGILLAATLSVAPLPAQVPGSFDTTFQAQLPTNFCYQIFRPLAVQPDGKIIVGGTCWQGEGPRFLARLNPDGTLDSSFNPASIRCEGASCDFRSIVVQADGKIVLGGYAWEVPELGQLGLTRLNADGTVDSSFVRNPRYPFVTKLVVLPNGSILVSWSGGPGPLALVRLKPNREIDPGFAPKVQVPEGWVFEFAVQPDGRIVVSISEPLIDGTKRNVIRLLPDGSYDPSFEAVLTAGDVHVVETLPDGRILLGANGIVTVKGYVTSPAPLRLQVDGQLDLDFLPFTNDLDPDDRLAIQRDGKIIVRQFWRTNGFPTRQLVRLNRDGSRDETFVADLHSPPGTYEVGIRDLVLQPDGKLLVAALFLANSGAVGSIARLHGDGAPFLVPASLHRNTDGTVDFQVTTATNRTVIIEAADNLKPDSWEAIASFLSATNRGPINFRDADAGRFSRRFYRARTE